MNGRATVQLSWPVARGPGEGPWGGAKRLNVIKFKLQSQFKRFFIPNFVCVLTNKRY